MVLAGYFAGLSRRQTRDRLTERGAVVGDTVSEQTDLVFAGEPSADAAKTELARALGVAVHDEAALLELLDGPIDPEPTAAEPVRSKAAFLDPLNVDSSQFAAALGEADWSRFAADRDLPPLRAALLELEKREGITEAHHIATSRLRDHGAVLRHPEGHHGVLITHALSPDGRYLALGSWGGDDYERGGAIQIWEVATGRCVNLLGQIMGGVGWHGYANSIQWSIDGTWIAAEYNTSVLGLWDPFGSESRSLADCTSAAVWGCSRPVGFGFAPSGDSAFFHLGDGDAVDGDGEFSGLRATLVRLQPKHSDDDDDEPEPIDFRSAPPAVADLLGKTGVLPERSVFSADGTRLWGYGEPRAEYGEERTIVVFGVDITRRRMIWAVPSKFDRSVWRMSVSPDERLITHLTDDRLQFIDAATGQITAETPAPGEPVMLWNRRADRPRMALVPTDGTAVVRLFAGTEHDLDLDLALKQPDYEQLDAQPWAWSPDGSRAACLTTDDRVEVWSMDDQPHRIADYEIATDCHGVLWGADEVLVLTGLRTLRFLRCSDGTVLSDTEMFVEVPQTRPLWHERVDLGAYLEPDPTFALDRDTWAVAFGEGVVIAPPDRDTDLDAKLAWAVDRRYGWPVRWGMPEVYSSVFEAFDRLSEDSQFELEDLHTEEAAVPAEWPPPNVVTEEGLLALAVKTALDADAPWSSAVSSFLRHTARWRARIGDGQQAVSLARQVPDDDQRSGAIADVALILAAAGDRETAAELVAELGEDPLAGHTYNHSIVSIAAPLAGVHSVLGDTARADALFARAQAATDPETNAGQLRLAVCWALMECGRVEQARTLWRYEEPAWSHGHRPTPSGFFSRPWLMYLLHTGRDDIAGEFLFDTEQNWYSEYDVIALLVAAGRPDLLREYLAFVKRTGCEAELAEAGRDRSARPDEADIAALREARKELLTQPPAQRRLATINLIGQAARCGHLGAAFDLLLDLPDERYSDRGSRAAEALWIHLTGTTEEIW